MKVVVINSIGPMASTVVGSVVEKFGYLNIPVRKLGLHDYLSGSKKLNDGYFKKRVLENLESHSKVLLIGGVSVNDRDSSKPRQLVDMESIKQELEVFNKKNFSNLAEMYGYGRNLYSKSLKYKKSNHSEDKHIEYTTDLHIQKAEALYQAYTKEFSAVHMINLHRSFAGWLDSLVSQRFAHPSFRTRYIFVFHSAYNMYRSYEDNIKNMPGLHLDFDKLFIPRQQELVAEIAKFLDQPIPELKWETEQYDLFGKFCDFHKTFTKADNKNRYLSNFTLKVIEGFIKKEKISIFHDGVVYLLYLCDLFRFQSKKLLRGS